MSRSRRQSSSSVKTRCTQLPRGTWVRARSAARVSMATPVVRAGFTVVSSEPVRANQGIEEVPHEGQPHGSGDHVFPHAPTTHRWWAGERGGDAALTALDAT